MNNMTAAAVAERARAPQTALQVLPDDGLQGTLVGRVWAPQGAVAGPAVVALRPEGVFDLSAHYPTMSTLLDATRAQALRSQVIELIGENLADIRPGSPEAMELKTLLQEKGLWSQYLEVGIGPDAEVFTKAPVLASVGCGDDIGIRSDSAWNNPEPEVVLAVNSRGQIVGATLGNDVNLRDIEGRSALLLG